MNHFATSAVFLVSLCIGSLQAGNWPEWRGPNGDGSTSETGLPMRWSATENVAWKIALPGPGNSTPVVWEKRIFLTQSTSDKSERLVMCLSRSNGRLLWERGVEHESDDATHKTNPHCSSSPVTDGERVIVWFGSAGLHCYDLDGKLLWKKDLGTQAHIWGYGASPKIHGDLVYLNFGPGARSFLIAMDKRTGKTVWRNEEPGGSFGNPVKGKPGRDIWVGSWSTPIVRKLNGREELLMAWPRRAVGLNPKTGKEYWECDGLNPLIYTSPVYGDGIMVAMGGYGGKAIGVRIGGRGNVTESHRLWYHPKTQQRIGSSAVHEGHCYILNDPGVAECIEMKSGEVIWKERLKGPGATSRNWSSMVLSDGKLYANNWSGDTIILNASPEFEVLEINSIGDKTIGSIAVSDGDLFIRGYKYLWCISEN